MEHSDFSSLETEDAQSGMSGTPTPPPPVDAIEYWKAGTHEVKTFRGHSQGVWSVSYSPDGLTLALSLIHI